MADGWKRGLPPERYYPGIAYDYDVYFSPGGAIWHREITSEERAKITRLLEFNDEINRRKADGK